MRPEKKGGKRIAILKLHLQRMCQCELHITASKVPTFWKIWYCRILTSTMIFSRDAKILNKPKKLPSAQQWPVFIKPWLKWTCESLRQPSGGVRDIKIPSCIIYIYKFTSAASWLVPQVKGYYEMVARLKQMLQQCFWYWEEGRRKRKFVHTCDIIANDTQVESMYWENLKKKAFWDLKKKPKLSNLQLLL